MPVTRAYLAVKIGRARWLGSGTGMMWTRKAFDPPFTIGTHWGLAFSAWVSVAPGESSGFYAVLAIASPRDSQTPTRLLSRPIRPACQGTILVRRRRCRPRVERPKLKPKLPASSGGRVGKGARSTPAEDAGRPHVAVRHARLGVARDVPDLRVGLPPRRRARSVPLLSCRASEASCSPSTPSEAA